MAGLRAAEPVKKQTHSGVNSKNRWIKSTHISSSKYLSSWINVWVDYWHNINFWKSLFINIGFSLLRNNFNKVFNVFKQLLQSY